MPLSKDWATLEDFATLFQYLWYRDFPTDLISTGAKRTDWTIHTGIAVRDVANMMGLVTRFERRGRKDAVLRSADGDEIAIEWEWDGVWYNEIDKLKNHKIWRSKTSANDRPLRYAVLVSYTHTENIERAIEHVKNNWEKTLWPLLLILVDVKESKAFSSGKDFNDITMYRFDSGQVNKIRSAKACPWKVDCTHWYIKDDNKLNN